MPGSYVVISYPVRPTSIFYIGLLGRALEHRYYLAIKVQPILSTQTHALRHAVLRPQQRLSEMAYAGDDAAGTFHLGAFESSPTENRPIGIVSLYQEPMPGEHAAGDWRLRGMAVDAHWQGRGVGASLLNASLKEVAVRGGARLWCNARVTALGFYQKLGFVSRGEPFVIEHIGLHDVMSVAVAAEPR